MRVSSHGGLVGYRESALWNEGPDIPLSGRFPRPCSSYVSDVAGELFKPTYIVVVLTRAPHLLRYAHAMSTILLRNGLLTTFVNSDGPLATPTPRRADVLIKGDTIAAVEAPGSIKVEDGDGTLVIDCQDKWIAPGFVDTHR